MNAGELIDLRSKWEAYADLFDGGDNGGSLVGASFIIAKAACTDIPKLLDLIDDIHDELQVTMDHIDTLEMED